MRRVILPICLLLGACVPGTYSYHEPATRAAMPEEAGMPPMKAFSAPRPLPPQRSNRDIQRDILDLGFQLESGRMLQHFSRFEGPITVRVTGEPPITLISDLNRLMHRLQTEAGINISRVSEGPANITIEAVSRDAIQRSLPKAACFVVPNISRLSQYRAARNSRATDWSQLRQRERIAIFVPNDTSPQEVRDCLHEELAQALGPLNDLYRLSDSVFNDDNVHAVLTGFDMLVLKVFYAPELRARWNAAPPQQMRCASHRPSAGTITAAPSAISRSAGSPKPPIPILHRNNLSLPNASTRRTPAQTCTVPLRPPNWPPMPSPKGAARMR